MHKFIVIHLKTENKDSKCQETRKVNEVKSIFFSEWKTSAVETKFMSAIENFVS